MNNRIYIRRILSIILLTNILAALTLPLFFSVGAGWIFGSLGSGINFWWLAKNVEASLKLQPSKSKKTALKGTYFRFMFLLVYSVLILSLIKPNPISFGLGLLAAQMVIYINELINGLKESKFFRG